MKDVMDVENFKEWLNDNKALSLGSIKTYSDIINTFLKRAPDLNNPDSYAAFLIDRKDKSINNNLYALQHYIEYKIKDTQTKKRIKERLLGIHIKKHIISKTSRRQLTYDDALKVINNLKTYKHRLIALMQLECGLRASEIFYIKYDSYIIENINNESVIKFKIKNKGGRTKISYIFDDLLKKMFLEYIEKTKDNKPICNYLTCENENAKEIKVIMDEYPFMQNILKLKKMTIQSRNLFSRMRYHYQRYWDDLKQSLVLSEIDRDDWATHDFRRNFAKRVYEFYNKDLTKVKKALNHAQLSTTLLYVDNAGFDTSDILNDMQKNTSK